MMLFFFNDTATTEIYTLSLHDALPICKGKGKAATGTGRGRRLPVQEYVDVAVSIDIAYEQYTQFEEMPRYMRSEEHTSELQSRQYLVCRLLLEKKKTYSTVHRIRSNRR